MKFSIVLFALVACATADYYHEVDPRPALCNCDPPPYNVEGVEVICPDSLPDGQYPLYTECSFVCSEEGFVPTGGPESTTCLRAVDNPGVPTEKNHVWIPGPPSPCRRDPETTCPARPLWSESTPGPVGTVTCGPELPDGGFLLGDTCDYACPEGYTLIGSPDTTCVRITNVDGELVNEFVPENPCCELTTCDTDRESDVLFVLDRSTSVDSGEWESVVDFVETVTDELSENPKLRFGVVVFGKGILTDANIPFQAYSGNMYNGLRGLKPNGEGTYTITALEFVNNDVFLADGFNDRPDADNLVIFVTDGVSSIEPPVVDPALGRTSFDSQVEELHFLNAQAVYSVGIGLGSIRRPENRRRGIQELNDLAKSSGTSQDVFDVTEFESLSGILNGITQIVCEAICPIE